MSLGGEPFAVDRLVRTPGAVADGTIVYVTTASEVTTLLGGGLFAVDRLLTALTTVAGDVIACVSTTDEEIMTLLVRRPVVVNKIVKTPGAVAQSYS